MGRLIIFLVGVYTGYRLQKYVSSHEDCDNMEDKLKHDLKHMNSKYGSYDKLVNHVRCIYHYYYCDDNTYSDKYIHDSKEPYNKYFHTSIKAHYCNNYCM